MSAILAYVEHDAGQTDRLSLETLTLVGGLARATGSDVHAVMSGPGAREAAGALGAHGVSTVHLLDHPQLDAYAPGALAAGLGQVGRPGYGHRRRRAR